MYFIVGQQGCWGYEKDLIKPRYCGRDCGQLKDLISDRSRWRQDSEWECMSETCWKQHKTKEEELSRRVIYFCVWNDVGDILLVLLVGILSVCGTWPRVRFLSSDVLLHNSSVDRHT